MRALVPTLVFWLFAAASSAHAGGTVNVSFVAPEQYTDAGNSPFDRPDNLKTLAAFMQTLGAQYLADGQVLDIAVLNVDLAGFVRPTRHGDLRIVHNGADWPSFDLRYTLSAPGQPPQQREEHLSGLHYGHRLARYAIDDPLRHEKQMLDTWFRQRFGAATQ